MSNHNIYIKMHTNTYVYTYHIYKWLYTDFVFRRVPEASFRVRPKKTERQAPWPLALRRTSWKLRLNKGLGAMWWFFRENMEGFCVFSMLSMFFYGSRIFFYGFSMIFLCFSMFFFAMFFASYVFLIKKTMRNTRVFPVKTCGFQINISTFHRTDLLRVRSEVPFFLKHQSNAMKKGEKVVIPIGLWVFIRRFPQVVSPIFIWSWSNHTRIFKVCQSHWFICSNPQER